MLVYFRLIGETDRTVLLKISREIQEDSAEELVATSPAWRSVHDFDASQHASPVSAGHFKSSRLFISQNYYNNNTSA